MIELKDVSCSFSDRLAHKGRFTAVSSMTANFEDGGRYAIVGESGSGKTTLARMIAGLQRPSTGAISVDGSLVYGRTRAGKEHFKKVQIIQQNSASCRGTTTPGCPPSCRAANRNGWQSPGRWPQSRNASFLMRRPMVSIYLCERRSSTRLLTYSIDLALR